MAALVQDIFGRYIIFNLMSFVDWLAVNAETKRQVDIDNVWGNARPVTHDYAIGNQVYVEITGIYHKLDYNK